MVKRRKWSVLWLSMFMASMSGLAIAAGGPGGGHGGPPGGGYGGPPGGSGWHGGPPGGPGWHGGPPPGGPHGGYGGYPHGGYGGYGWYGLGVGIALDPFLYWPWYYPGSYYYPPYYYPPGAVSVPATPPVYIERGQETEPAPQASASWYYCADPKGYYPYVENCPGGWQTVAPRPPASSGEGR
jgi:hypothetical protein